MKRIGYLVLLALICVGIPEFAMAANHYVRSGAAGNNSGSDWTNAWSTLPSALTRGDTYYVADGSYGSYTFKTAASGSTRIYVKKAIASDHGTDTGWLSSYGDGQAVFTATINFNTSYWTFDGQTGSGKAGYGFKIITNGANKLLRFDNNPAYVTVSHVDMQHRGINTESGDDIIYTLGANHLTISRSYLHDCGRAPILLRGTTDSIFEYLYVARNWSTATEHSEGISAYNGTHRNIVRHSVWEDITGTGVIMFDGDGWELYGNLLFYTPGFTGSVGNGAIATWTGYTVTNAKLYNNTFVNLKGWDTGIWFDLGGSNKSYNNLWYNCERVKFGNNSHDYDWFYNAGAQTEAHLQNGSGDPFVNSAGYNFHLKAATASGMSLSSPYNIDMEGRARGGDGAWDRGAYEYGGSATAGATPSAPGSLTVN